MRQLATLGLLLAASLTVAAAPLWVGVADERRAWSRDGMHWNDITPGDKAAVALAYGAGRFIAVGQRIEMTTDGLKWRDLGPAPEQLDAITFGRGRFIALSGTRLYSSETGERFVAGKSVHLPEAHCLQVAGGDSEAGYCYVAIGRRGEASWRGTTSDGQEWDVAFVEDAPRASALCYGAGHFVIVGPDGLVETSHDGFAWERQTKLGDDLSSVRWNGERFEAKGRRFWTSPDGVVWSERGEAARPDRTAPTVIAVGGVP